MFRHSRNYGLWSRGTTDGCRDEALYCERDNSSRSNNAYDRTSTEPKGTCFYGGSHRFHRADIKHERADFLYHARYSGAIFSKD